MINLDVNEKSAAQIRLAEKLEKDRQKLQEQIQKDRKKIEDSKKKARSLIGDVFTRHLPDFYNFEASELTAIIDTAMGQRATKDKIAAIRKAANNPAPGEGAKEDAQTDDSEGVADNSDEEQDAFEDPDDEESDDNDE